MVTGHHESTDTTGPARTQYPWLKLLICILGLLFLKDLFFKWLIWLIFLEDKNFFSSPTPIGKSDLNVWLLNFEDLSITDFD